MLQTDAITICHSSIHDAKRGLRSSANLPIFGHVSSPRKQSRSAAPQTATLSDEQPLRSARTKSAAIEFSRAMVWLPVTDGISPLAGNWEVLTYPAAHGFPVGPGGSRACGLSREGGCGGAVVAGRDQVEGGKHTDNRLFQLARPLRGNGHSTHSTRTAIPGPGGQAAAIAQCQIVAAIRAQALH